MNLKLISAALSVTAAAAAAFAAISAPNPAAATSAPASDADVLQQCFSAKEVDAFDFADEQTLYVRVNAKDIYRVKMSAPCTDVDFATELALKKTSATKDCSGLEAQLSAPSRGPKSCTVASVTKMTPVEVSEMPNRYRP